ncbi:hypothetical protein BD414DRAFT_526498 [Trametes punicea]|nr:hypothetical protein BD414DRAFT_526498 [Trametes punicea]
MPPDNFARADMDVHADDPTSSIGTEAKVFAPCVTAQLTFEASVFAAGKNDRALAADTTEDNISPEGMVLVEGLSDPAVPSDARSLADVSFMSSPTLPRAASPTGLPNPSTVSLDEALHAGDTFVTSNVSGWTFTPAIHYAPNCFPQQQTAESLDVATSLLSDLPAAPPLGTEGTPGHQIHQICSATFEDHIASHLGPSGSLNTANKSERNVPEEYPATIDVVSAGLRDRAVAVSTPVTTDLPTPNPNVDTVLRSPAGLHDRIDNGGDMTIDSALPGDYRTSDHLEDTLAFTDPAMNPLPSSPPLSSSPPQIFSSPPGKCFSSPSSSPPLWQDDRPLRKYCDHEPVLDARAHVSTDVASHHGGAISGKNSEGGLVDEERPFNERSSKRMKSDSSSSAAPEAPLPKRLTQLSVAKQRQKLAAPFRSPVVNGPLVQGGLSAVYSTGRLLTQPPRRIDRAESSPQDGPLSLKPDHGLANKDRTAKAAKQFKSPLVVSKASASTIGNMFSTVSATPTIQALQGKLQTLKQAIKIKNSGNEDQEGELERLVHKWTTVGREVACALWDYVKDLDPGSSGAAAPNNGGWYAEEEALGSGIGQKRGFHQAWGLLDEHAIKRVKLDEEAEETEADEENRSGFQHTLGTMLRHLGIDPATLGWDDEEGDFVDA